MTWDSPDALTVLLVLFAAGGVAASFDAFPHATRFGTSFRGFSATWREIGALLSLGALFVAALPYVTTDDFTASTILVAVLVASGLAVVASAALSTDNARLEPAMALVIGVVGVLLVLWEVGSDFDVDEQVGAAGWAHAAFGVIAYVGAAAWFAVLGVLRDSKRLTFIATAALVVFTTFQAFAVFAAIVQGAWLFVLLGLVFAGTGYLADRARRQLARSLGDDRPMRRGRCRQRREGNRPMRSVVLKVGAVALVQLALVGVAVAPRLSARLTGDEYRLRVAARSTRSTRSGAPTSTSTTRTWADGGRREATPTTRGTRLRHARAGRRGLERPSGYSRERPSAMPYLACDDRDWQVRCGIESLFLPQDEAAAMEADVASGVDGRRGEGRQPAATRRWCGWRPAETPIRLRIAAGFSAQGRRIGVVCRSTARDGGITEICVPSGVGVSRLSRKRTSSLPT